MKKFFAEFKTFITRGNVVDLAVGVIIGGAFTAIVNALTNQILMPIVNWILAIITGGNGMEGAVTFLSKAYLDEAKTVIDLENSIYIDWGAFVAAIINFLLIALVLFFIVKLINKLRDPMGPYGYTKKEYITLRKSGKSDKDIKKMAEERDAEAAKKAEEEAAEAARLAAEPSSTDKLLAEILDTLKNK